MTSTEFQKLAAESARHICEQFGLRMTETSGCSFRLDGPEIFVTIAWDVGHSHELGLCIGLQRGVVREVERPFMLSELLRVSGHCEVPEAQMDDIITDAEGIDVALRRSLHLLTKFGQEALRGDRVVFRRLDVQRDLDCMRYEHERDLYDASRAAFVAWVNGQYGSVVSLLRPFRQRLTIDEERMLDAAEARLSI